MGAGRVARGTCQADLRSRRDPLSRVDEYASVGQVRIDTDRSIDVLNTYLVGLIEHVRRFCAVNLSGLCMDNDTVPCRDHRRTLRQTDINGVSAFCHRMCGNWPAGSLANYMSGTVGVRESVNCIGTLPCVEIAEQPRALRAEAILHFRHSRADVCKVKGAAIGGNDCKNGRGAVRDDIQGICDRDSYGHGCRAIVAGYNPVAVPFFFCLDRKGVILVLAGTRKQAKKQEDASKYDAFRHDIPSYIFLPQ